MKFNIRTYNRLMMIVYVCTYIHTYIHAYRADQNILQFVACTPNCVLVHPYHDRLNLHIYSICLQDKSTSQRSTLCRPNGTSWSPLMYAWGFGGLKPPYPKNFMEIRGRKEGEEEKKKRRAFPLKKESCTALEKEAACRCGFILAPNKCDIYMLISSRPSLLGIQPILGSKRDTLSDLVCKHLRCSFLR